jgi:predicted peptidase
MGIRSGERRNRRTLLKSAGTMTGAVVILLTTLTAAPPVAAQAAGPVETGFLNGQVTANSRTMRYVVYVPRDYAPEKQWPVILFLHGGFAGGKDGFRPLFLTLPPKGPYPHYLLPAFIWGGSLGGAVTQHPERFPCLVVWPQLPSIGDWVWYIRPYEDLALRVLEEVVQKYNGDRSRLYLTGLSAGGEGTWQIASDHPELFAAAMPVASTELPSLLSPKSVQSLKSLPLWVLHGEIDAIAPAAFSRKMVAAIQAAGNTNIRYTEYPGVDHNSWDIAYNDPQVIAWLLAQKR